VFELLVMIWTVYVPPAGMTMVVKRKILHQLLLGLPA
jgi:hypothetical protein